MLLERSYNDQGIDAEISQLAVGNFDVDFFLLNADQIHFGNAGDTQQLLAHIVDIVFQFGMGKAVGRESVNGAVGVAEFVIEGRSPEPPREDRPEYLPVFYGPDTQPPAPLLEAQNP